MPRGTRRIISSRSNGRLLETAAAFVATHPETILTIPGHSAGENLVHRADGRRVPLITWAAPVDWTGMGHPDAAVWVLEDLTALQRSIRYGDSDTLYKLFVEARSIRRGIIEAGQDTAAPDFGRQHGTPKQPGT